MTCFHFPFRIPLKRCQTSTNPVNLQRDRPLFSQLIGCLCSEVYCLSTSSSQESQLVMKVEKPLKEIVRLLRFVVFVLHTCGHEAPRKSR